MSKSALTIKRLSIRDVLRVSVVDIAPDGDVVTLGGANASGKSSVLNAIEMALSGLRAAPPKPIRRGAERGQIVVDLGDLVVERTFTAAGSDLVVKSKDGARYPKPQAMLDALFAEVAFDPLAFARLEPGKQAETLRRLVGVDVSDLDAARERAFAERTEVHRDGKAAKARLDAAPMHADASAAEVDPADIARELEARLRQQRENADVRSGAVAAERAVDAARADVQRCEAALARARADAVAAEARATEAQAQVAALQEPDVDEVRRRFAAVEAINRAVRENRDHAKLDAQVEALRDRARGLTERIAEIDDERAARIAAAAFPVEGLGFGESGVTLHSLPFEQASTAEKLRVSVAVGIAAQPRLRVFFVRDGSLLDADNLRALAELAATHKCQLWVEDARTADPHAVIISDGTTVPAPVES